jgi:two-component system alkaline phosphatase synthesis response regulator PhoP
MSKRILVVDDEDWVVKLVRGYLEEAGFRVATASDGAGALAQFDAYRPALVILDLMLPEIDGLEVARRIRKRSDVPIIMLTARGEEPDRVAGLELGADDYVVKPFSPRELVSRVRAVLRRAEEGVPPAEILEFEGIRLDMAEHKVWVNETPVELTPMEFDLLAFLMRHPARVFTRLQLLEAIRGVAYESFERSIDAHIKRLRQKIELDPKRPRYVVTVYGVGYKFSPQGGEGER